MKKVVDTRPWGMFERFTLNEKSTVKLLTLAPRQRFSLQYHHHRAEFWKVLDDAKVTIGKKTSRAKAGSEFLVKPKTLHRIQAYSKPVRVLEISFGSFDEHDLVRVEDDYRREKS